MGSRTRTIAALAGLAGLLLPTTSLAAPSATGAEDAPSAGAATPAETLTHRIRFRGRTLTLRMQRVDLRGEHFEVLRQGRNGTLRPQQVPDEQAYVGRVGGDPYSTASALVRQDGTVAGAVAFDRGVDIRFEGATVQYKGDPDPYDRGIRWPASETTERNATVEAGRATGTYSFDLGFDMDASYFVDRLGSSVPRAVDDIDEAMLHLYATYSRDAMLRPVTGRVVLRGSAARSPYREARRLGEEEGEFYASHDAALEAAKADWAPTRAGGGWDDVMVLHSFMGGGLASLGGLGTDNAFGSSGVVSGSMTQDVNVVRHELGHNLGMDDYHTDGPEDETIMSGNHFARFDGTELRSMWDLRDDRLATGGVLDPAAAPTAPLPPYAALDLLDGQYGGVPVRFLPLANDHDANGEELHLVSVQRTSQLGGTVSHVAGQVRYVPPDTTEVRTDDWFRYVVADSSGQRSTGVVIARVSPAPTLGAPATWARSAPVSLVSSTLTNRQSGLQAASPVPAGAGAPVQRSGDDRGTRWRFTRSGEGYQVVNARTKRCLQVSSEGRVVQRACAAPTSEGAPTQRWTLRQHPYGGTAVVSDAGSCLTVGSSLVAGTALGRARCTGSAAERWSVDPVVPSGSFRIVSALSGGSLAMPDGPDGYQDLVVRSGDDDAASWQLVRRSSGAFVLLNRGPTGQCAFYQHRESQGPFESWHCDDSAGQDVTVTGDPVGGFRLRTYTGFCATVEPGAGGGADGAAVVGRPCDGSAAQRWDLARP